MLRLLGEVPLRRLLLEAAVFALVVKGAERLAERLVDRVLDGAEPEAAPTPTPAEAP